MRIIKPYPLINYLTIGYCVVISCIIIAKLIGIMTVYRPVANENTLLKRISEENLYSGQLIENPISDNVTYRLIYNRHAKIGKDRIIYAFYNCERYIGYRSFPAYFNSFQAVWSGYDQLELSCYLFNYGDDINLINDFTSISNDIKIRFCINTEKDFICRLLSSVKNINVIPQDLVFSNLKFNVSGLPVTEYYLGTLHGRLNLFYAHKNRVSVYWDNQLIYEGSYRY